LRINAPRVATWQGEANSVTPKPLPAALVWVDALAAPAESSASRQSPVRSIDAARAGDAERAGDAAPEVPRLETWFRDHFDTLWRLAFRLGTPRENVDDIVQEAFITASQRASEIARGSERAFLIGVTVRVCANQRRRRKLRRERTADLAHANGTAVAADAEHLLAQKQLRELLDRALDALPPEQRSVLVLHEIEGFSAAEIAGLLQLPMGTVGSRLRRARNKFSKAAERLRARWPEHR
jgi:RNA polymerase sigma-70 factor, ECF subfamily